MTSGNVVRLVAGDLTRTISGPSTTPPMKWPVAVTLYKPRGTSSMKVPLVLVVVVNSLPLSPRRSPVRSEADKDPAPVVRRRPRDR